MKKYKRYVSVVAICNRQGILKPISIIWDNNQKYPIDKILEIRQAASQVGGNGIRYRCLIGGHERHLFYEINRWFIESYVP